MPRGRPKKKIEKESAVVPAPENIVAPPAKDNLGSQIADITE